MEAKIINFNRRKEADIIIDIDVHRARFVEKLNHDRLMLEKMYELKERMTPEEENNKNFWIVILTYGGAFGFLIGFLFHWWING